jgi:hypothetical protein
MICHPEAGAFSPPQAYASLACNRANQNSKHQEGMAVYRPDSSILNSPHHFGKESSEILISTSHLLPT